MMGEVNSGYSDLQRIVDSGGNDIGDSIFLVFSNQTIDGQRDHY